MIKAIGIGLFTLLALGMFAFGWLRHEPAAFGVGGMTLVFVAVLVLGSTVLRKWMDTKESGDVGMKVIRKAARQAVKGDGN